MTRSPPSPLQVEPTHLDQLLHPQFADEEAYKPNVMGTGLPASPGAAVGQAVFNAEDAETWKASGLPVSAARACLLCFAAAPALGYLPLHTHTHILPASRTLLTPCFLPQCLFSSS